MDLAGLLLIYVLALPLALIFVITFIVLIKQED